jgi:hypothetical protein
MEEWHNCTEDTVLTLMRAERRVAKAHTFERPRNLLDSSSEDDLELQVCLYY